MTLATAKKKLANTYAELYKIIDQDARNPTPAELTDFKKQLTIAGVELHRIANPVTAGPIPEYTLAEELMRPVKIIPAAPQKKTQQLITEAIALLDPARLAALDENAIEPTIEAAQKLITQAGEKLPPEDQEKIKENLVIPLDAALVTKEYSLENFKEKCLETATIIRARLRVWIKQLQGLPLRPAPQTPLLRPPPRTQPTTLRPALAYTLSQLKTVLDGPPDTFTAQPILNTALKSLNQEYNSITDPVLKKPFLDNIFKPIAAVSSEIFRNQKNKDLISATIKKLETPIDQLTAYLQQQGIPYSDSPAPRSTTLSPEQPTVQKPTLPSEKKPTTLPEIIAELETIKNGTSDHEKAKRILTNALRVLAQEYRETKKTETDPFYTTVCKPLDDILADIIQDLTNTRSRTSDILLPFAHLKEYYQLKRFSKTTAPFIPTRIEPDQNEIITLLKKSWDELAGPTPELAEQTLALLSGKLPHSSSKIGPIRQLLSERKIQTAQELLYTFITTIYPEATPQQRPTPSLHTQKQQLLGILSRTRKRLIDSPDIPTIANAFTVLDGVHKEDWTPLLGMDKKMQLLREILTPLKKAEEHLRSPGVLARARSIIGKKYVPAELTQATRALTEYINQIELK